MLVRVSPSEYVVRMGSGGKLMAVGQGMSFWAWPWDSYVRFPATLQWMLFSASQVTRENQGVDVKGAFSWRVVDPVRACQNLNMDAVTADEVRELLGSRSCELERCATADQGPLMRTTLLIRQLAESVTRNAVANMMLEETLRNRRSILETLTAQIDAVVEPWGIAIASIEIVDIRVASREVFSQMQAQFRERLRQQARVLQLAADEEIAQNQLASAGRIGRLENDKALAEVLLKAELSQRELESRQAVEKRRQEVEAALQMDQAQADARLSLEQATAAARCHLAELEAKLERQQKEHAVTMQRRRDKLDLMARRNEVMGQVNEAYRSQRLIELLPQLTENMKADKTTVFANSMSNATLEGLATSLMSMAEVAGIKFGR